MRPKIMANISVGGEAGGAGGAYSCKFAMLSKDFNNIWSNICTQPTEDLLEEYWKLMLRYQPNFIASWLFQRAMSAKQQPPCFPCLLHQRASPLKFQLHTGFLLYSRLFLYAWFEKARVFVAMALRRPRRCPQRLGTPLPGEVTLFCCR
ncbi:PREDICTED: uncharacterized protein LOC106342854 isoform X2 [Brassica oleracea var. oleracea]|uniref:uncharacterized protein LOC106342854 isoform X2 n=1 Tax=Brassica oleracea var. oleracea TaxID=109376 RepID=UPI0006A7153E|nr:PREDICTED: uncharacterized protein LOC106342854 isoform X2 [Brassica oleracea var. oleracea]